MSYVSYMSYVNYMSYVKLYELCKLSEYFLNHLKSLEITWITLNAIFLLLLLIYKNGEFKL